MESMNKTDCIHRAHLLLFACIVFPTSRQLYPTKPFTRLIELQCTGMIWAPICWC